MSYELIYTKEVPCPCGRGKIIQETYSNDWNTYRDDIEINCAECKSRYHKEYEHVVRSGEVELTLILVPLGETIYRITPKQSDDFPTKLCICHPLESLKSAYRILCDNTASSKIKDGPTKTIIKECKDAHNTMRITTVRGFVLDAISVYDSLDVNFDKDTKRIADVKNRSKWIKGL